MQSILKASAARISPRSTGPMYIPQDFLSARPTPTTALVAAPIPDADSRALHETLSRLLTPATPGGIPRLAPHTAEFHIASLGGLGSRTITR